MIDKSNWPRGEWDDEEDNLHWHQDGFACLIRRHEWFGHFNGYVGVDIVHPLYGLNYCDEVFESIGVHGGLTYSGLWEEFPGFHWFGFDCNHTWDWAPGSANKYRSADKYQSNKIYRNLAYVRAEVESLVRQLAALS